MQRDSQYTRKAASDGRAEQGRGDQSRAEESRAGQRRPEQGRGEQSRAEASRAGEGRAGQRRAEQGRAEQGRGRDARRTCGILPQTVGAHSPECGLARVWGRHPALPALWRAAARVDLHAARGGFYPRLLALALMPRCVPAYNKRPEMGCELPSFWRVLGV